MSESYRELEQCYLSGELSEEKWDQWKEFYRRKLPEIWEESRLPERIGTLDATEYRVSDTQTQHAEPEPLTLFETAVVFITEPLHAGLFVVGLVVFEPWLW